MKKRWYNRRRVACDINKRLPDGLKISIKKMLDEKDRRKRRKAAKVG